MESMLLHDANLFNVCICQQGEITCCTCSIMIVHNLLPVDDARNVILTLGKIDCGDHSFNCISHKTSASFSTILNEKQVSFLTIGKRTLICLRS